jgi:hypothetical protein
MVAMRRYFRNLLRTLDGAPPANPSPRARRGQSLVEMTLIMPILLVMLLGLIEIAWLANHFLILMDVSRSAARYGATLDPLEWVDGDEHYFERMDVYLPITDRSHLPAFFEEGVDYRGNFGFYDGVACTAIQNMRPLVFDTERDDVVVSVFAYASGDYNSDGNVEVRVTGRFPARQNECSNEPYDPFDVNDNGSYDPFEDQVRMIGGVNGQDQYPGDNRENVRGYVLTGHHHVSDAAGCIGSEFSTQEIEDLLNGTSSLENTHTPNNSLLLVEVFWHHRQLLQLRWFTAIGDDFELNVWSMYPVSAAEPTATPHP